MQSGSRVMAWSSSHTMTKPVSTTALYDHIASVIQNARPFVRTKTYFGPDRRRQLDPNYKGPERRGAQQGAAEISSSDKGVEPNAAEPDARRPDASPANG